MNKKPYTNPHVIDQDKHKQNSKDLGRLAAQILMFFIALFAAVSLNVQYLPQWPLFIILLVGGGFYLVPKTRALLKRFDENRKEK